MKRNEAEIQKAALDWLFKSNDTGLSSEALCAFFLGVRGAGAPNDYPSDADDIGRCFRLLDLVPEWRERIREVAELHPQWAEFAEHWAELEALYDSERFPHRLCSVRMDELQRQARRRR